MLLIRQIRRALPGCLGLFLGMALVSVPVCGQSSDPADNHGKPLPMKPDLPAMARNHRLILKDGSYQVVHDYKIVGDRVRYLSQERGEWEEMPTNLVDWDATKKWEQEHTDLTADADSSPAMKEAESIDKEETEEREGPGPACPRLQRVSNCQMKMASLSSILFMTLRSWLSCRPAILT